MIDRFMGASLRKTLCLIMLLLSMVALAEPVDSLLEIFDRKPTLKNADAFFTYLYEQEFTDEPRMYQAEPTPSMDTVKALVWYWAGEWYYAEQEYQLAEKNLLRALELMEHSDDISISDNLAMLGLTYMRQCKYEEALQYMRRCYRLDCKSGDPDRISSSLNTIAGTLLAAGNPTEAEGYILRAISYAKQVDNPARMAVIYGMASEIEHAAQQDELALLYADSACAMEATTGNTYKMMVRLSQKASILDGLGRYEEAEEILNKTVPFFREVGDQMSLVISLNKAALAAYGQEKYDEALPYLYEVIEICQRIGDIYNEAYAQREVYEILFKENPDEARMHLERYHLLKDSLYSHATAEQLARFNAEFGRDELQKEKELLTKRNHMLVWLTITGILAVIIGVVAYEAIRRRKDAKLKRQLGTIIDEMNAPLPTPAQVQVEEPVQETPPVEEEEEEVVKEEVEHLTPEDKQFLKKLILAATEAMDNHQAVSVTNIASIMCLSSKTLTRRIQNLAGEGAKRYLSRIQLEQARIMLLKHPDYPISEVSNKCGFEDHSSFTRAFSGYFGMSPSDYRSTHGQG